jgi:hypothetical protein
MTLGATWNRFGKPIVELVQAVGILLAGIGLILTAIQIQDARKVESAEIGLKFAKRLSTPSAIDIIDAAEAVPMQYILTDKGGKSSDDQLEAVLGDYDTLYYLRQEGLINERLSYNMFCFDLEHLYDDKEVTSYLADARRTTNDQSIYAGFDRLTAICKQWEKSGRGRALAR